MNAAEQIIKAKMVPVVRTKTADQANRMIEILVKNGVNLVEVTLTIPSALEVIKTWSGKAFVGAGTVLTSAQAKDAIAAGAKFCVSPGFDQKTHDFCKQQNHLYVPGALTPTEVMSVQSQGLSLVKIFPASAMGGEKYLKAISRVFPQMKWMATGGVNLETMSGYLKSGVVLGVGESMMPDELMEKGEWAKIENLVREYYGKL